MDPEQMTDEEVAGRVQAGDTEAFGVLMHRYSARLLRYAQTFLHDMDDAEDVVEEAFIRAYRNLQDFDPAKRFSPWIYRIVHNQAVTLLRKNGKRVPILELDDLFPPRGAGEVDEEVLRRELIRNTDETIERLEMKYKEPLTLYYLQEMSYREIAEVMRIPVSTVGIRIKRGKALLQKLWNQRT